MNTTNKSVYLLKYICSTKNKFEFATYFRLQLKKSENNPRIGGCSKMACICNLLKRLKNPTNIFVFVFLTKKKKDKYMG